MNNPREPPADATGTAPSSSKFRKSDTARKWMKRADHSVIFIFIAGSYTPFALLALPERSGIVLTSWS